MSNSRMLLLMLSLIFATQGTASPVPLSLLEGKWSGTLTYLDYKDNTRRVELKTTLVATRTPDGVRYRFSYVEPNGKAVEGDDTIATVGPDSRTVRIGDDEWTIVGPSVANRLILERAGEDGGKPARMVRTFSLADRELRIETVVTPASGPSLVRNVYVLRRTAE